MPHGRLTPLGRRLRIVLANFHVTRTVPTSVITDNQCAQFRIDRLLWTSNHAAPSTFCGDAARSLSTDCGQIWSPSSEADTLEDKSASSPPSIERLLQIDINERTKKTSRASARGRPLTRLSIGRSLEGLSDESVASRSSRQKLWEGLSLPQILRTHMRNTVAARSTTTTVPDADQSAAHNLSPAELAYLKFRGYSFDDLTKWVDITLAEDGYMASQLLVQQSQAKGMHAIPLFVLLHLLQRDYVSARAIRLLADHTTRYFEHRRTAVPAGRGWKPSVFITFELLRHARRVLPHALPSIVGLWLNHLTRTEHINAPSERVKIARVTLYLNRMLRRVSLPTSERPFKDNPYQERAIACILEYMSEHNPPIQTTRNGYRAVVQLQLAQRKAPNEQQWAELKALSWPPWKVDRTAMDTPIDHVYGASKAAGTLAQMQEAGYAPLEWEKVAKIYTGWDLDGTPTVRRRALMPQRRLRRSDESAVWVSRLHATRTVQEAWACYLAWEDRRLPADQNVHLAMFEKLREVAKRTHGEARAVSGSQDNQANWRLFAGDRKELDPLPPSTHLYTYTKTPPPTVEEFYNRLRERGVVFRGSCLAFLISHARSLKVGFAYLLDNQDVSLPSQDLSRNDKDAAASLLPRTIFVAVIKLLCRFAAMPLHAAVPTHQLRKVKYALLSGSGKGSNLPVERYSLDQSSCLILALKMLQTRRTVDRTAWNAALRGLAHEAGKIEIGTEPTNMRYDPHKRAFCRPDQTSQDMMRWSGAIVAYRLARRLLASLHECHLDLDAEGFQLLCFVTENSAVGSWSIIEKYITPLGEVPGAGTPIARWFKDKARLSVRGKLLQSMIKEEFNTLVGEDIERQDSSMHGQNAYFSADPGDQSLPMLLTVPSPALLHTYVRSLGWLADYEALRHLVTWMSTRRHELRERASLDRQGTAMMRKVVVALRVFLVRSWLSTASHYTNPKLSGSSSDALGHDTVTSSLSDRMRRPADVETIAAIQACVESVEEWGGWPTDGEVEVYCTDTRFELNRSIVTERGS